ncbi:unnamed protein product [Allacma fusca]|uniref:Uncharacterized protein n=1 Tax=Allacma fusca TaxID=39272 RepID=A0A8J2KEB0_9HEXA|nr:unnamed protein product [Allacma fusca]
MTVAFHGTNHQIIEHLLLTVILTQKAGNSQNIWKYSGAIFTVASKLLAKNPTLDMIFAGKMCSKFCPNYRKEVKLWNVGKS